MTRMKLRSLLLWVAITLAIAPNLSIANSTEPRQEEGQVCAVISPGGRLQLANGRGLNIPGGTEVRIIPWGSNGRQGWYRVRLRLGRRTLVGTMHFQHFDGCR
jgi:hypothetical protein